jgi:hypothetical protein
MAVAIAVGLGGARPTPVLAANCFGDTVPTVPGDFGCANDYASLGDLTISSLVVFDTTALTVGGNPGGVVVDGAAVFVFDSLTITSTGILKGQADRALVILVENDFIVEAGGLVDVDGETPPLNGSADGGPGGGDGAPGGIPPSAGGGTGGGQPGTESGAPGDGGGGGGGGFGGIGGSGGGTDGGGAGGPTYGDFFFSTGVTGGSGGGSGTGSVFVTGGGGGGGVVMVSASGSVVLAGTISADGGGGWGSTFGASGGGSGGGIILAAEEITFTGHVSARGGDGGTGGCCGNGNGGGGGGGRIFFVAGAFPVYSGTDARQGGQDGLSGDFGPGAPGGDGAIGSLATSTVFVPEFGPLWQLEAKIGGGNTLNPFLPDYTPGTWSNKPVTVYLDCVPNPDTDEPIVTEYKDASRKFNDGIHTWEHAANDTCIDADGQEAEDLDPYGPIMVDTKAPNCRVTPGTLYIPRNTTGTVTFALDLSDIGPSGVSALSIAGAASGGAILHSVTPGPGSPPTSLEVNATMPNSTAAKVVVNISVTDDAGNSKTCTATVKAK